MNIHVLGILELSSIADGLLALDGMVKAAPVSIVRAEPVNPGKYLIIIEGDVASVEYAMERGIDIGQRSFIDQLFLKNIDEQIVSALLKQAMTGSPESLGILETLSITTGIEAADMAVKATGITVLGILFGNEYGGKAVVTFSGDLGDIEDAMNLAAPFAEDKGQLYRKVVIPGPHADMRGFIYGN